MEKLLGIVRNSMNVALNTHNCDKISVVLGPPGGSLIMARADRISVLNTQLMYRKLL